MQNLSEHANIIFKDLKINKELSFFDLWKECNEKTNLPFGEVMNLNNPLVFGRILKCFYLYRYFNFIKNLKGDILEVGVFKGFSGYFLSRLNHEISDNKKNSFFLIDSFEGLSDIKAQDKVKNEKIPQHKKGHFKVEYEKVKNIFSEFENINIIKGWIPSVFKKLEENNFYKFVHIDVDLYQPTIDTLKYVFKRVIKGGIIITDDFRTNLFPGNQKAWIEFFKQNNITGSIALPSGQAVYIKN